MSSSRVFQLPSGSSVGRKLDDDDENFVIKSSDGQNIFFRDWVNIKYRSEDPKKRILVVTNFRVMTIKNTLMGRQVRQRFPMTELSKLTVKPGKLGEMILEFGSQFLVLTVMYEESVLPIVHAIMFAFESISYGRPADRMPQVSIPPELMTTYIAPGPDGQDGLLASYLAQLDFLEFKMEKRLSVLEFLMASFQRGEHACNIGECFKNVQEVDFCKDVEALSATLRYSTWFTDIIAINFPLKNSGLAALATNLFETETKISRVDLVDIKAKGTGWAALAKSFAVGKHSIKFLNLSKNNIGDAGIKILCDSLLEGKRPIDTLCLRECQLGPKGIRSVTGLVDREGLWQSALKVLDLSGNALKRAGNQALAEWLGAPTCPLEELYLVAAGIDGEILFPAIKENKNSKLRVLNISANTLSKKSFTALCELIQSTPTCTQISVSSLGLTKKELTALFTAIFENPHNGVSFLLDCSNNSGLKGSGAAIMDLMVTIKKKVGNASDKLEALSLNDCGLGSDGVIAFCTALRGLSLVSLGLSRNAKGSMFGSDALKKSGEAIAVFIQQTPKLTELTLSGTGGYALKAGVEPIIQTLIDGKTDLQHLDLSGNKMGDKLIQKLSRGIAKSSALRSISIDGNEFQGTGLKALRDAIEQSDSMSSWTPPDTDLKSIVAKIKSDRGPDTAKMFLTENIGRIEAAMERNRLRLELKGTEDPSESRVRSQSRLSAMSKTTSVGVGASTSTAPTASSRASALFAQSLVQASPRGEQGTIQEGEQE